MRLGKLAPRHDSRTLRFADYINYRSPLPPAHAHWGHGLPFEMLGNDQYGDCVEAGYAHLAQVWGDRAGKPFVPTDAETLGAYSAITGFNPDDPSTDQGTDMLTACGYWKSTGIAGIKIDAYATLGVENTVHFEEAIAVYGGAYVGLSMPLSAQNQIGGVWDVTTGPDAQAGSWGGHCVPLTGYDSEHVWCVTWGAIQTLTWRFLETYCDEAYVFLSQEWLASTGESPSHLSWGKLQADLANL